MFYMGEAQRKRMNLLKMIEMKEGGLAVGVRVAVEGVHGDLHNDDMPGGGPFMHNEGDAEHETAVICFTGHVIKVEPERFYLAFGWNKTAKKPLAMGGIQIYGNAVRNYGIY